MTGQVPSAPAAYASLGQGLTSSSDAQYDAASLINVLETIGVQAAILGCTETHLLINDSNSPLPTLDSTRLLARAAIRHATS